MQVVRWLAAVTLAMTGACAITSAYSGLAFEKYREPANVSVAELEQGAKPPSIHVAIDDHWAVWEAVTYTYPLARRRDVDDVCYPVVSLGSSVAYELQTRMAQSDKIPLDAAKQFHVFVLTSRFSHPEDIPTTLSKDEPLSGMLGTGLEMACGSVLKSFGLKAADVIVLREGENPLHVPFKPLVALGLLLLIAIPAPVVWARHLDKVKALVPPPNPSYWPTPYRSSIPAPADPRASVSPSRAPLGVDASQRPPPPGSMPPGQESAAPVEHLAVLLPGTRVVVRHGERRLEATVIDSTAQRCHCEFTDGRRAWVLLQDVEG